MNNVFEKNYNFTKKNEVLVAFFKMSSSLMPKFYPKKQKELLALLNSWAALTREQSLQQLIVAFNLCQELYQNDLQEAQESNLAGHFVLPIYFNFNYFMSKLPLANELCEKGYHSLSAAHSAGYIPASLAKRKEKNGKSAHKRNYSKEDINSLFTDINSVQI